MVDQVRQFTPFVDIVIKDATVKDFNPDRPFTQMVAKVIRYFVVQETKSIEYSRNTENDHADDSPEKQIGAASWCGNHRSQSGEPVIVLHELEEELPMIEQSTPVLSGQAALNERHFPGGEQRFFRSEISFF